MANAKQKYAFAKAAVPNITGRAAALAVWVGIGMAAVPGCVAGGAVGASAGASEGGPLGAAAGGAAGCLDGAATAVGVAAPAIMVTMGAVALGTYAWETYEANFELNSDLNACNSIP
jgi:hypothetical protein